MKSESMFGAETNPEKAQALRDAQALQRDDESATFAPEDPLPERGGFGALAALDRINSDIASSDASSDFGFDGGYDGGWDGDCGGDGGGC